MWREVVGGCEGVCARGLRMYDSDATVRCLGSVAARRFSHPGPGATHGPPRPGAVLAIRLSLFPGPGRGAAYTHPLHRLWALSSDGSYFVVQASGGPRRYVLRPGASVPAALGDRQASSLQRVQASKVGAGEAWRAGSVGG